MKPCKHFNHLLDAVKKHSDDVRLPFKCFAFATGTIKGYVFRLFQELNTANETDDKYAAYLCIKDEKSKGSMWRAFYNQADIDEWVKGEVK